MRWAYIVLSILLFRISCFSIEKVPTFRETIAKYGYTDKDSLHSYVEPYERLLSPYIEKRCNLLEIGVSFGGSAMMWYEHLPQTELFLLDIQDNMMSHITSAMDPIRWQLYVADAYTFETLTMMKRACPTGFDIIIDDGPHTVESQMFVINEYLKLLKTGGILIIEDIQDFFILIPLIKSVPVDPEYKIEIIDLRSTKGRYDDLLFVVRKG